jgi:L-lactate dehydrogenase (cytochrome)
LCWEDIPWSRKLAPGIPIVVKGVGCVEDVEEAKRYGADGVVLVSLLSRRFVVFVRLG